MKFLPTPKYTMTSWVYCVCHENDVIQHCLYDYDTNYANVSGLHSYRIHGYRWADLITVDLWQAKYSDKDGGYGRPVKQVHGIRH